MMSQMLKAMFTKKKNMMLFVLIGSLLAACSGFTQPTGEKIQPTQTQKPTAIPTEAPMGIEFEDATGTVVMLDKPAQKIVSIAPSNTEILFAIGAGIQVVGRDMFSDYPEAAQSITDLGGGWGELDMETLVTLEPDLILASVINAEEQIQQLRDLGMVVFTILDPIEFSDLYRNIEAVAQLTGHEAEAEILIHDLQERVSAVEEKIAGVEDRPLVFYELDATEPNAPWTPGPGAFIDVMITSAGGDNLGKALDSAWAQISLEALIEQDPDVIILGDYTWGGVTPEDVQNRAGWESLTAVKKGLVHIFDDNLVSRPGPRLVDGLEEMAKLFYPDMFK